MGEKVSIKVGATVECLLTVGAPVSAFIKVNERVPLKAIPPGECLPTRWKGTLMDGLPMGTLVLLHGCPRRVHRLVSAVTNLTAKVSTLVLMLNVITQVIVVHLGGTTTTTAPGGRVLVGGGYVCKKRTTAKRGGN